MKFSWLLNGSTAAHHLAAVYLLVWVVQGGYAAWMVGQWMRLKRTAAASLDATTRDRS